MTERISFHFDPMRVGALIRRDLGNDAVDLVRAMQRFPHLYELRHPKTADDVRHMGEQFRTYLSTRDWATIENPAL